MIYHLEKPHLHCSLEDSTDSQTAAGVKVFKINGGNTELGLGFFDKILVRKWPEEDSWHFGNASINKAFDTSFYFVKGLVVLGADCVLLAFW